MIRVKFLLAPIEYRLYLDEIIDYADSFICVPVEDMGLKIICEDVDADNSFDAVRIASRNLFNKDKGYNFIDIAITYIPKGVYL